MEQVAAQRMASLNAMHGSDVRAVVWNNSATVCDRIRDATNHRHVYEITRPEKCTAHRPATILRYRYWVSWKADGTRYLLLLLWRGCYLIDRSYKVARIQMRFPNAAHKRPDGRPLDYPVGCARKR